MTFYRVYPEPRIAIDPNTPQGRQELSSLYAHEGGRIVRANMIVTPTGQTTGDDGTSGSLSNPADRDVVATLRRQADAVIIGAETLRRERIPLPPSTPLVVVTRSGNISWGNVAGVDSGGELVVVTDNPNAVVRPPFPLPHRILGHGRDQLAPSGILDICRAEGWDHLLLEGGRHTLHQFVSDDLVDELCLTLTGPPRVESIPPIPWWPDSATWSTVHLLTDDNRMLYQRYQKTATPTPQNLTPSAR